MKEINIKLFVKEDDFCLADLMEVLTDGFSNVGNHTLVKVEEVGE